jgi:hypothetical protein
MKTYIINISLPFSYQICAESLPDAIKQAETLAKWEIDHGCLPDGNNCMFEHGTMSQLHKGGKLTTLKEPIPPNPISIEKGAK